MVTKTNNRMIDGAAVNVDDYPTLAAAFTEALAEGKDVVGSGVYILDTPIYLNNVTDLNIDLNEVIWTGDTNLGNGTDRLIGAINIWGGASTVTAVSGSLTEGTTTFTVASSTGIVEGGDVQLQGGYTDYLCKVVGVVGNDVALDYALGWDNTGQSLSIRLVTPCDNVQLRINKFTDNSGATDPDNMVNATSTITAANCSVSIGQIYNTSYPAIFTSNTYNCKAHRSYLNTPRDVTAGRGYLVQWNKAHKCHNYKLLGHSGRHLIDYTRAAHCTALLCQSMNFQQYPYTTHGAWEHDLTFTDCSNPVGKYAVALAQAGPTFGEQTKNVVFKGGTWDGDWLCDVFPTNVTLSTLELVGYNSILTNPTYRFGGNGHFTLDDVQVQNDLSSMLFRGLVAAGYPQANVNIVGGSTTGKYLELNGIDGVLTCGDSVLGQFFTSGGVVTDVITVANSRMNQWGGTTVECNVMTLTGCTVYGQVVDARMTVDCQRFIKVGGEDIGSPSFGILNPLDVVLSAFRSFAGRTGLTIHSYAMQQMQGSLTVDSVGLLNREASVRALDVTSTSTNRIDLQLVNSKIDGGFDCNDATIITSAIVHMNRFKVGQTALIPANATYLVDNNLVTL